MNKMARDQMTPEEEERLKKSFYAAMIRGLEKKLIEYEQRILDGDEDAAHHAHGMRVSIELFKNPPPVPPPPPKMTTAEYFEKYGMPAAGRRDANPDDPPIEPAPQARASD